MIIFLIVINRNILGQKYFKKYPCATYFTKWYPIGNNLKFNFKKPDFMRGKSWRKMVAF